MAGGKGGMAPNKYLLKLVYASHESCSVNATLIDPEGVEWSVDSASPVQNFVMASNAPSFYDIVAYRKLDGHDIKAEFHLSTASLEIQNHFPTEVIFSEDDKRMVTNALDNMIDGEVTDWEHAKKWIRLLYRFDEGKAEAFLRAMEKENPGVYREYLEGDDEPHVS